MTDIEIQQLDEVLPDEWYDTLEGLSSAFRDDWRSNNGWGLPRRLRRAVRAIRSYASVYDVPHGLALEIVTAFDREEDMVQQQIPWPLLGYLENLSDLWDEVQG